MIDQETVVVRELKKHFNLDLNNANLIGVGKIVDYGAHILTKNSPWTPIVSQGFRKLEDEGRIRKLLEKWLPKKSNKYDFPPKAEGIKFDRISLLFIFLAGFYFISSFMILLEYLI